ncbi:MAG: CoA-binding protein [Terriglobales bacterium]|jgi:uncharacterized protein
MTTRFDINDFLAHRRLALVGLSRNPKDFSCALFRELRNRGYDMVPVNPLATEVQGCRSFARLQDINPPVEGALVMTPPHQTLGVVHDCAQAGIRRVWMYRGVGQGAVSTDAVDFCIAKNIRLVEGYCPFMFFPGTSIFHRFHGFLLKLAGNYPASRAV